MDALKLLNKERQKRMKQYPNLVDYEAKLAFKSFYEPLPMPEHGMPVEGHRRQAHAARRGPPQGGRASVPARERRRVGEAQATSASVSRAS